MKPILSLTLVMLSLFLFNSVPARAEFCEDLRTAVNASSDNFSSIKGAYEDNVEGSNYYATSVSLDPLGNCDVTEENGEWEFSCSNGYGRKRVPVSIADIQSRIESCRLQTRGEAQTSHGTSRMTSIRYEMITDRRSLAKVSLTEIMTSASSPLVSLSVSKLR